MGRSNPTHFCIIMNENDYKTLIITYQQKSFDLFSQVIALEAKLASSKQLIEALTFQVNELNSELENLKSKNKKVSSKPADNLNSGEF